MLTVSFKKNSSVVHTLRNSFSFSYILKFIQGRLGTVCFLVFSSRRPSGFRFQRSFGFSFFERVCSPAPPVSGAEAGAPGRVSVTFCNASVSRLARVSSSVLAKLSGKETPGIMFLGLKKTPRLGAWPKKREDCQLLAAP